MGKEVGWGSLAGSLGRAHLDVSRDEETQSETPPYPLLTGRLSIKIQTITKPTKKNLPKQTKIRKKQIAPNSLKTKRKLGG